jgi:hypothetical protein
MVSKKAPRTHNTTPSAIHTHHKPKKVVSTSALFAQIPKLKAAPASKQHPSTAQPQPRKIVKAVIPKKALEHPLLQEWNGTSIHSNLSPSEPSSESITFCSNVTQPETTKSYTTSLLDHASSTLLSAHTHLLTRLTTTTPSTFHTTSEKTLRALVAKPLPTPPSLAKLKTLVAREEELLADLGKEHATLLSEIESLVAEILQPTPVTKEKQGVGAKGKLDHELVSAVTKIREEIGVVGDEERKELEMEMQAAADKRKKIVEFFMGLDEE